MLAGGECAYEREPRKESWPLCGIYTTTLGRWHSGYHGFQLKVSKLVLAELLNHDAAHHLRCGWAGSPNAVKDRTSENGPFAQAIL